MLQYDAVTENAVGALLPGLRGSYPFSPRAVALLLLAGDDEIVSLVRAREGDGAEGFLALARSAAQEGAAPVACRVAASRHASFAASAAPSRRSPNAGW